jgi:hypothetical protein
LSESLVDPCGCEHEEQDAEEGASVCERGQPDESEEKAEKKAACPREKKLPSPQKDALHRERAYALRRMKRQTKTAP